MSNQQGLVSRPWFRLASMMRPPPPPTMPAPSRETQQPEPVPPPRPAFIRPTFIAPAPPPPQEPTRLPPPPVVTPPPPPPPPPPSPLPSVVSPSPPSTVVTPALAPPSPRIVASSPSPTVVLPAPTTPSPRFVGTVSSPTVATPSSRIVAPSPSPTLMPPAPTMPSPRIGNTAPSPQIVATQPPPSPVTPQAPAANGSSIPPSPITKAPFPSFSSPKPKVSAPSSSSPASKPVPVSPPPPTRSPSPSQVTLASSTGPTTTIAHSTTLVSSPKIVKPLERTPPPSLSMKPFSHPPSPLILPPPQIKSDTVHETRSPPIFEQKTVLVQETKEKPKASPKNLKRDLYKPIGETHSSKRDITKDNGNHKKYSDSEDFGTRIITIAGENKGAIMELSPSRRTTKFGHIEKGSPRSSCDNEKLGSNSGDIAKENNQKAIPSPMTTFMNSNVQGVNNSILYNYSTTHHDPGVHFSVSRKPNDSNGIYLKNYGDGSHN